MCGKFTAMASWSEVVDFSQPLTVRDGAEEDRVVGYRVMSNLPVIVFDREAGKRRVVPMRWGFPHPNNWRSPQPIHARSETIESKQPFRRPFAAGQRGIVVVKTFNEAPDVEGRSEQHTITPGDGKPLGIAFLWDRFTVGDIPMPLLACVMVTVPANALIATLPTDRMPAILADEDWSAWLGETESDTATLKAMLKTVEGVDWRMAKEEKPPKAR
jgi:putative SOS response-associated peptidase YedK